MSTAPKTLTGFLNRYDPHGGRTITTVHKVHRDEDGNSPLIVVRHGRFHTVSAWLVTVPPGAIARAIEADRGEVAGWMTGWEA